MKLLLDTHTFIWWDREPELIGSATLALMQQDDTQLVVSIVSLWEIQIKTQIGKLNLQSPLAEIIAQQQSENGILLLSDPNASPWPYATDTTGHDIRDNLCRRAGGRQTKQGKAQCKRESGR